MPLPIRSFFVICCHRDVLLCILQTLNCFEFFFSSLHFIYKKKVFHFQLVLKFKTGISLVPCVALFSLCCYFVTQIIKWKLLIFKCVALQSPFYEWIAVANRLTLAANLDFCFACRINFRCLYVLHMSYNRSVAMVQIV